MRRIKQGQHARPDKFLEPLTRASEEGARGGDFPPKADRERRRRVVRVLASGEKETRPGVLGWAGLLFDFFRYVVHGCHAPLKPLLTKCTNAKRMHEQKRFA